jgi:hypothetical protein
MEWSLQSGSREFGVSPQTLKLRLSENGVDMSQGSTRRYTTLEIHRALVGTGDMEAAKYRETVARAELLEIEVAKATKRLIEPEAAIALINRKLGAERQQLVAMPSVLGPKANPSDPAFGIEASTVWRDGHLRFMADVSLSDLDVEAEHDKPARRQVRGAKRIAK